MKQTMGEHPPEAGGAAGNGNAPHGVRADLKAYLDGELSGLSRWLTARHVARCASCHAEMRRLEHLGRQVQMLDNALPASHLRARILASLPAAPPAPIPATSRYQPANTRLFAALSRRPLSAAVGLCALLLMVGAFALARYGRTGATDSKPAFAIVRDGASNSPVNDTIASYTSPGSAQRLAPSPPQSATPTPTQPDPFAPDTTAQVGGKDRSGADTGATQQSAPTGADDTNNQTASLPTANAAAAYTDPTSAAADRIAATIIPDKLREKRQATGAVLASASIHPSNGASIPLVKMPAPAPMQMAVAVVDVSEASRQVRKWAEQAGAQVTVVSSRKAAGLQIPDAASDTVRSAYDAHSETGGASTDSAILPVSQTATILRLRVPVQQAAGLETYLSHMAKSAASGAHNKGEETNAARELKTEVAMPRPYPIPARVFDGEPTVQSRRHATVTILVRLQAENPVPHP